MGTTFKDRDITLPRRCKHCGKRPNWWGMRFGFEKHRIWNEARTVPYQDRYMLCLGLIELRLHKFWRGDDDRAPHDHPWWFVTFPFASYVELVASPGQTGYFEEDRDWWTYETKIVKRRRFHYRPPWYKHIVVGKVDAGTHRPYPVIRPEPFWTFVITGRKIVEWGFWRTPSKFTHHRDWSSTQVPR